MLTDNLFENCFNSMTEWFEENNKGLDSEWTWEDAS